MSEPVFGDEGDVAPIRAVSRFGSYVLCYELASGGMGTVYLAKAAGPAGFERLVALKRVHPHLAKDPRFATMFLDEARIAARIHHPNVCGVYEFGAVDGTFYLTMPYLVGEPLHRVLQACSHAPRSVREQRPWVVARLVVDACEGLHAAHELRDEAGLLLDVVHRDVSPQNLFVGYDGSVRLLDFGVASARHRLQHTSTGELKGKLAYLAPEQLAGASPERGVDIWALGVVLWEGLTGRRLFARDNVAATMSAVSEGVAPPLSDFVTLPRELQRVVDRALARDRRERFATAREMGRELLRALARHRVVGPADVSEWLAALFPDGRAAGERLVEASRVISLDEVSDVAPAQRGVPSGQEAFLRGESGERSVRSVGAATGADSSRDASEVLARARVNPGPSDGLAAASGQTPCAAPRASARSRLVYSLAAALFVVVLVASVLKGGSGPAASSTGTATPLASSPIVASPPIAASPSIVASSDRNLVSAMAAAPRASTSDSAPTATDASSSVASPPSVGAEAVTVPIATTMDVAPGAAPTPRANRSLDAPGRPGQLRVATPGGWAVVFRGRSRLGETPGTFALPAGPQEIGIQPFGEGAIRRHRVVIPPAGSERLTVPIR